MYFEPERTSKDDKVRAGYWRARYRAADGKRRTVSGPTSPAISGPKRHDATRPLLVDVAQAAAILSISRSSIYQLIWSEQLIPVRIGRSVRFSIEQLEQFVTDRTDHTSHQR